MIYSLPTIEENDYEDKLLSKSDLIVENIIEKYFIKAYDSTSREELTKHILSQFSDMHIKGLKTIFLTGGAAAGKSTLAQYISSRLPSSETISTDDYFLGSREDRLTKLNNPEVIYDKDLLREHIKILADLPFDKTIKVPSYHPSSGLAIENKPYRRELGRIKHLLIEGSIPLLEKAHYKIYLHLSSYERKKNWMIRNVGQGRENKEDAKRRFMERLTTSHQTHTVPFARKVNMIVYAQPSKPPKTSWYSYSIYLRKYNGV